ncbi:DUF4157 domain-containing protein [Flammeovirgaceae bacterium SG7u.111]|nr:DUF4157 domain-containing protein [Flammeovirgaceae bacterium SG7u.132]WPO36493.1 DUF4157 domain-containing protein [Flammeovirgaceae bacterium SG7u.111]
MLQATPAKSLTQIPKKGSSTPFFKGNVVYPKLAIGQSNDKYEQEADAIADEVMAMQEDTPKLAGVGNEGNSGSLQPKPITRSVVQKKCGSCEKEARGVLQPKLDGGETQVSVPLQNQLQTSKRSGSPLPQKTNQFMGNAFGADFSNVRVHTGGEAQQMNQSIQAKAFTHGSDIYFNKGQYSPSSLGGKKLLAHELTHVVQQSASQSNAIQRQIDLSGITQEQYEQAFGGFARIFPLSFIRGVLDEYSLQDLIQIIQDTENLISQVNPINLIDSSFFCQPFSAADRPKALLLKRFMQRHFLRIIRLRFGEEVGDLWTQYLRSAPGSYQSVVFDSPSSVLVQDFANSETTVARQQELMEMFKQRINRLCRSGTRVSGALADGSRSSTLFRRHMRSLRSNEWVEIPVMQRGFFLIPRAELNNSEAMNFSNPAERAGNIAGGISPGGHGPENREVRGGLGFRGIKDGSGRIISIELETAFEFTVNDAVDFCPGGVGAGVEQVLTIPLSRLEATGLAFDVPFRVIYQGQAIRETIPASQFNRCNLHL